MTQNPTRQIGLTVRNAHDATATRGWIAGAFLPADAWPAHTPGTEVKWGTTRAGETRDTWTRYESRATLAILVAGRFTILTSLGDVTLTRPGDYVTWGPGVLHSWRSDEDSTIITVRWPAQVPGRKPCRRWAPWRCDLQPTSFGGWVNQCVYCGREDMPES